MTASHYREDLPSVFRNNVFSTILSVLVFTFLVWYAQYHWKRRRLYRMAAKRKGPLALPIIGNALYFSGSNSEILHGAMKVITNFESPVPVWLASRLYFGVWGAKDLETILNSPHALQKDELYKYAIPVAGYGIFTADVPRWKRHRKVIMPTFNQKILDSFVEVFSEKSEILVRELRNECGKGVFDVFEYVSRCTLDIICETAMGVTVHAQTSVCEFNNWANRAMAIIYTRMFVIWYHSDFIFNASSLKTEQDYVIEKMHGFARKVVKEKREAYQKRVKENRDRPEAQLDDEQFKRKSFLQHLIELSEEGAKFTDEELMEEVMTFMIAGSDTTATLNSFLLLVLGIHPEIQERVYEEIMDVLGPNKIPEYRDLGNFHYLDRVLKEALRLFPLGPLIVRSIQQDIKLEECVIPAGSSVVLAIIGLHRDPKVYPDPLKFDPDRFLPEEVAKRHPYSWLPFSGGPRNCVGPKYAMMAMKSLIATVVRKYKITTTGYKSAGDIELKSDLVLKPVDGFKIQIEARE